MGKKALALLVVLCLVVVAGCASLKSLQEKLPSEGAGPEAAPPGNPGAYSESAPPPSEPWSGATTKVTLYFADPSGQYLVPVTREIPKVEGVARATLQELILGPGSTSDFLPTIPAGTVLRDINIRPDGVAIVDFSKELVANHKGGTTGEMLTVYSIVNTLTQFPTVKKVQLLVEGQQVSTLAGHLDIRETLARNEGLILSK
jgi:spore germination protein GerM